MRETEILAPTTGAVEEAPTGAPVVDPEALGLIPDDSDGLMRHRVQPLIQTEHTPIKVRIPDYPVGNKVRRVTTLPRSSRAVAFPWWQRPDVYWETDIFGALRDWRHSSNYGAVAGAREHLFPVVDAGRSGSEPTGSLDELPVEEFGRLVGLLRLVGVISTEHAGAITSDKRVRSKLMRLSERGVIEGSWHHAPEMGFPRVEMWRIRNGKRYAAYASRIADSGLSQALMCDVPSFGALPGVLHVRHQSLSVELMLRALEVNDTWVGWLPEAVCVPGRFLPPRHPLLREEREAAEIAAATGRRADRSRAKELQPDQRAGVSVRADGCLIRMDGHKIFLELQAQKSSISVIRKVVNWSRLLDAGAFGGVVLFAAASKPGLLPTGVAEIKEIIESEASPQVRSSLLVGSWPDWSPEHKELTGDAGTLRAARLEGTKWVETSAAEIEIHSPAPDWSLISRLGDLRITPEWHLTGATGDA